MRWPMSPGWTSSGSAVAEPTLIRAKWFDGRSSRGRDVLVALEPGRKGPALHLHVLDLAHAASRRFEHDAVEWPPQWSAGRAPERITVALAEHGSLEIAQPQAWQAALAAAGARPGLAQRMQTRWSMLLAGLAVAAIGLVLFYRYGTPWAAAQLTRHVPLEWELRLSQQAMAQVDQRWLKPSRLEAQRRAELRAQFAAVSEPEWNRNLYWAWLYCLKPLLASTGGSGAEGLPTFMKTVAWQD